MIGLVGRKVGMTRIFNETVFLYQLPLSKSKPTA